MSKANNIFSEILKQSEVQEEKCKHLCTETIHSGDEEDPHWTETCCDCGDIVDED